jgi:hypothetical protein
LSTSYPYKLTINQFSRNANTIFDKCVFFKYRAEYLDTAVDITRTSDPTLSSDPSYVSASIDPPAANPIAFDSYTR